MIFLVHPQRRSYKCIIFLVTGSSSFGGNVTVYDSANTTLTTPLQRQIAQVYSLLASGPDKLIEIVTLLLSRNPLSRDSTQRIICVKFHVLADQMFFCNSLEFGRHFIKSLIVNYLCASYFNGKRNMVSEVLL